MTRYNIYKRKDGRWEGRIPTGKKPNGKRKFKYIFGISKEQVRKKMEEFLNLEAQQSNDCTKTISALFTEWYNNAVHRVKESTAANYSIKANNHILPRFGDKKISEISSDDVYDFIELKQNDGLSNRYISDIVVLIKSIFKYAVRLYRIVNPMDGVVLPKKKASDIKLLDEDEQKKLQEHISNKYFKTLIYLLFCTLNGTVPNNSILEEIDMDKLYEYAEFHYVRSAVNAALESAGIIVPKFVQAKNKALRKDFLFNIERKKILTQFEQQGILCFAMNTLRNYRIVATVHDEIIITSSGMKAVPRLTA